MLDAMMAMPPCGHLNLTPSFHPKTCRVWVEWAEALVQEARKEPRLSLVELMTRVDGYGAAVPPSGPYTLDRDIYKAFGAEATYDAIAAAVAPKGNT